MNRRVQIFDSQGKYVTEWSDVYWLDNMVFDAEGNAYIGEVGAIYLLSDPYQPDLTQPGGRITIRDAQGAILTEWGEPDPKGSGMYYAPHGIALDSKGNLYVGEVSASYTYGAAPADWPVLGKYVRM